MTEETEETIKILDDSFIRVAICDFPVRKIVWENDIHYVFNIDLFYHYGWYRQGFGLIEHLSGECPHLAAKLAEPV